MSGLITHELDITGTSPANRIAREPHVITEINPITHNVLVPNYIPFFPNDFLLETQDTAGVFSPMEIGVDYNFSLPWYSFEKETGRPVYGAIEVLRKPTNPMIFVTYQTLGGKWRANRAMLLQALADYVWNPRIIQYDQITNIQETFPPNQHQQDLENFVKWDKVEKQLILTIEEWAKHPKPTLLFQQQVIFMRESFEKLRVDFGELEEQYKSTLDELKSFMATYQKEQNVQDLRILKLEGQINKLIK